MKQLPKQVWFRIGDIARWLDETTPTLRWWEQEFGGLLGRVERSKSGQRIYSRHNAVKFAVIQELLRVELYTIEGAKRQLRLAAERERQTG